MSIYLRMQLDGPLQYPGRHKRKRLPRGRSEPSFDAIVAADNLIDTFYELKGRAGQAPGPDGLTYASLSRSEVAAMMREMNVMLMGGSKYLVNAGRKVMIPKLNGRMRELTIRGILDRVIAAALHDELEPHWEKIFLPCSYGCRPGRGPWRMLADMERQMILHDKQVLVTDDIKDAFPSVVIADVMADHARYVAEPRLLQLIEAVVRGQKHLRKTGIGQGSAYSPACLNLRLHHVHDLGLGQDQENPLRFRYVDNLAYPVRSVAEGHQVRDQVIRLLEPNGFTLKGEDPIADLKAGAKAQLLGFAISCQGNRLRFDLGSTAWIKLEENLKKAHRYVNPPAMAK